MSEEKFLSEVEALIKKINAAETDDFIELLEIADVNFKQELSHQNLSNFQLIKADLSRGSFAGVNFTGADLSEADLSQGDFSEAIFANAILTGANLRQGNFSGADFTEANLLGAELRQGNFTNANLTRAYLSESHLSQGDFSEANLTEVNLHEILQDGEICSNEILEADEKACSENVELNRKVTENERLGKQSRITTLARGQGDQQGRHTSNPVVLQPRPDPPKLYKAIQDEFVSSGHITNSSSDNPTDFSKQSDQESLNTKTLKQIFQLSPIGMTILDLEGGFLSANQSFCEAVGYTERELIMLTFTDLTHPEDVPFLKSLGEQLLAGERQHFQIETRHWSKDEKPLHVGLTVTMVRDSKQRPICFLLQVINLTEQKWMEAQLRHRAFYDELTGLANRALFVNRLEQAVIRLERNASMQCAVLFLDLDRFKVINDSMGHTIGDQLLTALSGRLESCIRHCDTLARLGGDEFAILLEEIDGLDDALAVCERVHTSLKAPFKLGSFEVFANISIGVVCSSVGYEKSSDLLRNADTALYRAKAQGGSCHTVFDQTMHQRAVALWQMATQAQFAVQREELKLHYQPVIDIKQNKVVAVEALIRWYHPEHGSISPGEFIPVMEETGVITLIGQWVLREACSQMCRWQTMLDETGMTQRIKLNVNLSARQLTQNDMAQQVANILAETGFPAEDLRLEITETAIMHKSEEALSVLKELRALNVGLCIDDFGIGYSSLSRLQEMPIDILKIDRSFVQNIQGRGVNIEIVRTIIDLAESLEMGTVAKGIETEKQLNIVKSLRCQYAQGFYFSEPLPSDAAFHFIRESMRIGVTELAKRPPLQNPA